MTGEMWAGAGLFFFGMVAVAAAFELLMWWRERRQRHKNIHNAGMDAECRVGMLERRVERESEWCTERIFKNQGDACRRMNKLQAAIQASCKHDWEHYLGRWRKSSYHMCDCTIWGNTGGVVTETWQKCPICGLTRETPKKATRKKATK